MGCRKAVLRGKFVAIQPYLKKQEKHQIDSLTLHLKQLAKEKQQQKNTHPKLVEGRNNKDPSINKSKRNERKNSKD